MVITFLKYSIKSGYKPDMKYKSFDKPLYIYGYTLKNNHKNLAKFYTPSLLLAMETLQNDSFLKL
jgi:hypothetical protein